ncbi:MAG: hypothetical protein V4539_02875 [Bacteroidota bacterium]
MKYFFYFAAVLSACAAVYHVAAILSHTDNSPVWRHMLFCFISITGAWALVKRPSWLFYPLIVLTLQQLYSHGTYLFVKYRDEHSIHWISVGVLILMPVITYAVWIDRKRNQAKVQKHL